jgi:NAD-dependent deacetylase
VIPAGLALLLPKVQRVLFITGAGVSADSGLPTYRGVGGLYEDNDTEEGVPIELALSGQMLRTRPELCWRHIRRIESSCRGAVPNDAHHVIAAWERELDDVRVLTQNVDGFHLAAGSKQVIEIHGNVHNLFCPRCQWKEHVDHYDDLQQVPLCPSCGQVIRPAVVLFGEMLPRTEMKAIYELETVKWDAIFTMGTTSGFPYIAAPIRRARLMGIPTIEINPGVTEVSSLCTYRIREGAAASMRRLDAIRRAQT